MVEKQNRFKLNRPAIDEAAVKKFAAAAETIPKDKLATLNGDVGVKENIQPEQQESTRDAIKEEKRIATTPRTQKKLVTPKNKQEVENKWPWSDIDDKTARTTGYTLQFPASVYAKLKFLGENEPGGPSVRKIVMEALETHLEKKLAKYQEGVDN